MINLDLGFDLIFNIKILILINKKKFDPIKNLFWDVNPAYFSYFCYTNNLNMIQKLIKLKYPADKNVISNTINGTIPYYFNIYINTLNLKLLLKGIKNLVEPKQIKFLDCPIKTNYKIPDETQHKIAYLLIVNDYDLDENTLIEACKLNNEIFVDLLIKKCKPNMLSLRFGCFNNNLKIVKTLVENKIDDKYEFDNCIEHSIKNNNIEMVKFLVKNNFKVTEKCVYDACEINLDIVKILKFYISTKQFNYIYENYDIKIITTIIVSKGYTFDLCLFNNFRNANLIKLISEYKQKFYNTAFKIACKIGFIDLIKYFIKIKCKIPYGALYWACKKGDTELINILLDANCFIGKNAFNAAVELNDYDIVSSLIDKNCPMKVVKCNNIQIKKMLINAGCPMNKGSLKEVNKVCEENKGLTGIKYLELCKVV